MAYLKYIIISVCIFSFGFTLSIEDGKIIDLKLPSYTFSNLLEYEVFTLGEQDISLSVTHSCGKVYHRESRTLYGESYLEIDVTDFPKGEYTISVKCKSIEVILKTRKI